jgi:putative ABC transport system permease protein
MLFILTDTRIKKELTMDENIKMGGFFYLIKIAYRNIYRNKRRTVLSIIAIAISTFFIVLMMGFISGMMKSADYTIKTYETGDLAIYTKDFEAEKDFYPVTNPIEKDLDGLLNKIKQMSSVKDAFPRIATYAVLTDSNIKNAVVWGIDIAGETKINHFNLKTRTDGIIRGHYPADDEYGCAIGKDLALKMNVDINDKVRFKLRSSQYSDKYYSPVITGIVDFDYTPIDENYIIIPFRKLQKILALDDTTQSIVVYLNNDNDVVNTKKSIINLINDNNIVVKTWEENYFVVLFKQIQIVYYLIFSVFIILSSFLIINTVLMVIHERIKEIGMMGSLGMNKREIIQVFFFEAVILSIIGAFIGAIIGGIITLIASYYPIDMKMFSSKGIDLPTSGTIFIDFSGFYMVFSFFYGVIVSSLCTIFPSLKSAFVEPVEAIRR